MANSKIGIALILSAYDNASAVVNKTANNAIMHLNKMQKQTSAFAEKSFKAGQQLVAGGMAIGAPVAYAATQAMKFEEAMAGVAKVTNVKTGSAELQVMGKEAQALAVYLGKGSAEAAGMLEGLAQGGVAKANLAEVGKMAGEMAVAFDISADIAGDRFMKYKNAMNASIGETKLAMDAINMLSDKSAAEATQLLDFMASGGASVARNMKIAGEQMEAFGTVLIEQGKSGTEAATIYERLQKGIMKQAFAFKIFKDAGGGAAGVMAVLQKGMAIKSETTRNQFFRLISGEYSTDIMQVGRSMDALQGYMKMVGDKQNYLNSVNGEFQNRSNTTAFKIGQVKAQFQQMAISVGSVLLPRINELITKMTPIITKVTDWASKNRPLLDTILKVVVAVSAISLAGGYLSFVFGGVAKALSFVAKGFSMAISVVKGFLMLGRLMLANPWMLAIAAIAGAAYLIYKNWDKIKQFFAPIGAFFAKIWDVVKTIFMAAIKLIGAIILNFTPVGLIYKHWKSISQWFSKIWAMVKSAFSFGIGIVKTILLNFTPLGLIIKHWDKIAGMFSVIWDTVKVPFVAIKDWVFNLGSDFFNAGKNIVKSIWEGIKSLANKPFEEVEKMVGKMRDLLPFSPAKRGPLRDIHRIKLVETIAASIRPDSLVNAFSGTLNTLITPFKQPSPVPAGFIGNGGGGINFHYNPTINLSGAATPQDANNLAKMGMAEFEKMMKQWMAQKGRVGFS